MASPAEAAEMVASAAAASEAKGKEKRDGPGILGRIWRALFGGRGEDYEKRLQTLSKEEAALLARMRRRTQFSRRGVRNLIALSVLGEDWIHCIIRELAGLARKEDFPHVTYYCPHCHALNVSNQCIGQCSGSDSGQLSPAAPADGVSTTHPITETGLSSKSEVQELPEETNAGQQPVEPAN